jgi:hypothetical protein
VKSESLRLNDDFKRAAVEEAYFYYIILIKLKIKIKADENLKTEKVINISR